MNDEVKYSVCGYSQKHGYYRSKNAVFDTESEAIDHLQKLREDDSWRISTIIVKEIFTNKKGEDISNISADKQQRIWACSCKSNKVSIYRKSDFGRWTY